MLLKVRCFKRYSLLILFLILFLALAKGVEAAALYSPGETLNPTCLPTDTDCTVTPPVTISTATGSGLNVGSSGVEITDGGITFIKWADNGCINGQIPKFNGTSWVCGDDELGSVGLSTWIGSTNVTTLGTITTGVWNGSDVALGNYTSGNYVAGTTDGGGLIMTGTEGGTLGIQLDGATLSIGSSGLKLSDIGTSGTYGGALAIPVLTIDGQGRIVNAVSTVISGLGTSNFSSADISQWTNNSGYITSSIGSTLTNKTISGIDNNIINIGNSSLVSPEVTIVAGVGLSGGGTVYLGETVTLRLPNIGTSATYGGALEIPKLTTDAQGRVTGVTNTTIAGLTVSNFTAGDFSSAINTGNYSINISGSAGSAVSFSGLLTGDVSGTQGATSVDKIKGATLGVTTATSGNLLIGSGTSWVSRAMSGEATISSLGGITLNYAAGQSADGSHKGFLTAADWLTFNGKQDVLGYTAENNLNKSTATTLVVGGTASDTLYPSQKAVKTYVDSITTGLNWNNSLELITLLGHDTAPAFTPTERDSYIIDTGGNVGVWSTFAPGDAVQYRNGGWIKIKSMIVGSHFGMGYETTNDPYGDFNGKRYYLGTITGGSPGNFTYSFEAPENNDAIYVNKSGSYYSNVAFTYSSTLSKWVQLFSETDYTFSSGLLANGLIVELGSLTKDWNQTGVFNINTAGNINVEGGNIGTTKATASLFNTGATTLNIGGVASVINVGASGGTTLESNGALTINSYNGTTLTIDSATTGSVKLGTGNFAKAISIGNTNASTTLSINGGVTWSINNAGDLTTAGNISTTSTGTMTSAGLLTANNGFTVLSGGVSLPAGSIINNSLANSSLTITAGIGMSGGGSVSLGGTQGLAINLTSSGGIGSTASNSGLEVSGSGLTLLKGCGDGQILKYTDAGGWACQSDASGGASTLNSLSAADGTNTINNGDNQQIWNWDMTSASKTAFTFGENVASTNGVGSQYLVGISTLSGSTAAPLKVSAGGNIILDTTSAGGIILGSTTANSSITLQSGTGAINIGTDANAKTINIGTGAAANTLVIGSTNTTSTTTIQSGSGNINFAVDGTNTSGKVIIGNSGTTAPDLLVLDNGTSDPTGTNGATYYNSSSGKFRCYENGAWKDCITSEVQKTRSFGDTSVVTFIDSNTTPIFTGATQPNITLSSSSNKVLVVVSVGFSITGTGNDTPVGTIRRNIGGTAVCNNTRTNKIDSFFGGYTSDAVSYTVTNTVLDDPASTSTVYYTLCTDNTSVMADTVYKTAATITLIEVSNSNADLAEIYSTTDKTLGPGMVVSLDSNLKSGVKKTTGVYEKGLIGVVSSMPAITIGSVDDNETSAVPVALSGRVPVKVNTENGPIKVGDPLTSSSTPGVAMKATKAGVIIGTAMSDFNGEGEGQVLMFIKNGLGNGTKIADLLPRVDENATDFSKQILDELMWQKNNLVLTDLSEIITDRLVAGIEIITPKIVTDKTQTRNLCVGEEGNETCITKSQLDQLLSRFDIGDTEISVPTLIPTPTGIGTTLDTTVLTE